MTTMTTDKNAGAEDMAAVDAPEWPSGGSLRRALDSLAVIPKRTVVLGTCLVVGVLALAWFFFWRGAPMPERVAATELLSEAEFVAATGTELVFIGETGGGGMMDVRYRVIDPEKALVFHDETLPVGLYQPGGVFLERPFHEHSHDVELHRAVVYHELIVNTGSTFERGDLVTLVVGPYRLENVPIQ